MASSKELNPKSRAFKLNLYEEDSTHSNALSLIPDFCDYALIKHDSDIDDDGNLKKEHIHVFIRFDNPRYLLSVARDLGIASNYIRPCGDQRSFVRYLVHADSPNKFQYDRSLISTNISDDVDKWLSSDREKSEGEKVLEILDILDGISDYLDTRSFVRLICKAGLFDVYRRSQFTFLQALKEHNQSWHNALEGLSL